MINLEGVHFLLTYRCDLECDHCFVLGSPKAKGVFTFDKIRTILVEAEKLGTVNYISFEGGEPFLYYPILVKAVREALKFNFNVEVLSISYWASSVEDAKEWLLPFSESEKVELTLSSDLYHGESWAIEEVKNAIRAAKALGIKVGVIAVKNPKAEVPCPGEIEGVKVDLEELMYKGRAVEKLAPNAEKKPWREFIECPYEDLANPKRVHIDSLGYVHICQGICVGNAWQKSFSKIIRDYNPHVNPIIEPFIQGGPVALVEKYGLPHEEFYADACHLCYAARCIMRRNYPSILAPDQMYGKLE